ASFVASLGLYLLLAWFVSDKRKLLFISLIATACILLTTILADWMLFHEQIVMALNAGFLAVAGVQIGLALTVILFVTVAFSLFNKHKSDVHDSGFSPERNKSLADEALTQS
ncbi:MAG: PepSY domain-containing protein, partial [Shewanella sp.]|nr:PepSY domain-containing protein [Shewanella sp.]